MVKEYLNIPYGENSATIFYAWNPNKYPEGGGFVWLSVTKVSMAA